MSDSQLPKKPKRPSLVFKADEHDPEVVARLEADLGKGFGNSYVVMNVLDDLHDPRHRDKRDLVGVILGLLEHLTPEQASALAEQLPGHLPSEAVAKLATAATVQGAVSGVN